jgi:RNA polymerase sigma factor (sigma-70 family)
VGQTIAEAADSMLEDGSSSNPDWIRSAVDRYEGPLLRYAQRLTGDLETARDVVQEAFLRLCRQPRGAVDDHLAQWLFTVCRRRALDVLKKESRMKTSVSDLPADRAQTNGTLDHVEQQETTSQVLELLDRLPANQQEVVRLKFQAGLSYREISSITNLSVSNVGYLIHKAIATLRGQLAESSSV